MRLDEWQRWLEEQFLDTNPPKPPEEKAQEAAEAGQHTLAAGGTEGSVLREPYVPPQAAVSGPASSPAERPSPQARPNERSRPDTQPATSPPVPGVPANVDLPPIENYIPFLRPRAPEQPLKPPLTEPAPALEESPEAQKPHEAAVTDSEPASLPATAVEPAPLADEATEPAGETLFSGLEASTTAQEAPQTPDEVAAAAPPVPRKRRARPAKHVTPPELAPPLTSEEFWELVPRHIRTLISMGHDEGVQRSYQRRFKESRLALIERLLDPTLSLEETARLLNVCPATVRRYTNRGQLRHFRTAGDQRRFKLSDVLAFLEAQHSDAATRREGR